MLRSILIASLLFTTSALADSGYSKKNLKTIMDSKTANLMDWVDRNVKKDDTLVFDKFHGRDAVKITLSYDDKGHPKDWGRDMGFGKAQRIQIQEKQWKKEMLDGKEYWYKVSMFIPSNIGSPNHTTSFFDLKPRYNGSQGAPAFAFNITQGRMSLQVDNGEWLCWMRNYENASSNKECSFENNFSVEFENDKRFRDKWLDVVMQINMVKGKEIFRIWINEELLISYAGDINPLNEELGFKWGLYRNGIQKEIHDETAYYSDIQRASSCSKLKVNCEKFLNDFSGLGAFTAKKIVLAKLKVINGKPERNWIEICRGKSCENYGQ